MKEFSAEAVRIETAAALETVLQAQAERQYRAYIGLDVHKETIAVAVARSGRAAAESRGEIANKPDFFTHGFGIDPKQRIDRASTKQTRYDKD